MSTGKQHVDHVRLWLLANPTATIGPAGDWELPRSPRAALVACIRAAEMADWDLQTEQLADAILARFEVRLRR